MSISIVCFLVKSTSLSQLHKLVFLKMWSAVVHHVVHGSPQAVLEEKALQILYQTLNE
jgi:hypothetical protein